MKICLAQIKTVPVKGDLEANHRKLMALLGGIDVCKVDVVITPECFLDGYVCTEEHVNSGNVADYAVDIHNSAYVCEVSDWAARSKTWVIFGCMRMESGKIYNTALIIDRTGEIAGNYDKVHCQRHDKKYVAGNSLPVFDSDFGVFGVMICADRRWPEMVRTLALKGAQIIFNPTFGMHNEKNLRMMQTRSFESEVIIAFTHPEQSLVTDANGDIVCNVERKEENVVVTEIDLSEVDKVRSTRCGHLRDRRPNIYTK